MTIDFKAIRQGLAELPRASNHAPGAAIDLGEVYTPANHRNALDVERTLVVGNRGMGKSFWAHGLLDRHVRELAAEVYQQPSLRTLKAVFGFNASEKNDPVAPSVDMLTEAIARPRKAESIWRAVLLRAVASIKSLDLPPTFLKLIDWIDEDAERYRRILSEADEQLQKEGVKRLLVFDALDRLSGDGEVTQQLTRGLLGLALAAKSYRAIRFKLFMRPDQFANQTLFAFPDASKIKNDRVELEWPSPELYGLLFHHLRRSSRAGPAFGELPAAGETGKKQDEQKRIIDRLAGEFMGAGRKRGRVYTWLPLHLADAAGQISPRTFLTAWREAALHGEPPSDRAVDHHGIEDGVRQASEDRLNELKEDYPWIGTALEPLRGEMVPMEQGKLLELWRTKQTAKKVRQVSQPQAWPETTQLPLQQHSVEEKLMESLQIIGLLELRTNHKINIPDIFRIEAGIKRKGGPPPPRRKS